MSADDNQGEPSLDQLSQAFAEAMGRGKQSEGDLAAPNNDAQSTVEGHADTATADDAVALDPDEACPISPQSIVEAILFVGHPENLPIPASAMARLLRGVDEAEVEDIVETLNDEYATSDMPFFINAEHSVSTNADDEPKLSGYRLQLREKFDYLRESFYGRVREAQLSQLAIDVLAIVAYNQPVSRQEIDQLLNNGLDTGRVINQLVRRKLLSSQQVVQEKIKGKRKEYVTTDRFLDFFHLQDISDLPRSADPE